MEFKNKAFSAYLSGRHLVHAHEMVPSIIREEQVLKSFLKESRWNHNIIK